MAPACFGGPSRNQFDGVTVLFPSEPDELDPRYVSDAYGIKLSRLVFASLITIDAHTLEVVPDLAESVEQLDGITYRVTLRENLHFSDGSVLDANDVVATFRSVVDPAMATRYAATYKRIKVIETVDPLQLVFRLDEPRSSFITDLELPILRAEDAHTHLAADAPKALVGAGPFRISRRGDAFFELAANRFWHRGNPKYPGVRIDIVRDENTRVMRMLTKRADLALNVISPNLLALFENKQKAFSVSSIAGVATTYLGFNTSKHELHDARVRQAIAYAIDRKTLIATKFDGHADVADGFVPAQSWAYEPGLPKVKYDPHKARQLLDEAGYRDPDGEGPQTRFALTLRTSTDRLRVSIARAISSMLSSVGIVVDVRPSEIATLLSDLGKGRFDIVTMQLPEVFEPNTLSWFFASDRIPSEKLPNGTNRWRYSNEKLDACFAEGVRAVSTDARRSASRCAQDILAQEMPAFPLFHEHNVAVTTQRAKGFEIPRDGRFGPLAY